MAFLRHCRQVPALYDARYAAVPKKAPPVSQLRGLRRG